MASLSTVTTRNNIIPTTIELNGAIYGLEQLTLATSGSPNTYAQGYIDGLNAAVTQLQKVRDANYTSTPPLNQPSAF